MAGAEAAGAASEKKSLHATERDTEENRRRREAFVEQIATIAPEDLIYLDESGVSTQMTRLYGRAERGQRVEDTVPGGHWKMLTVLGAMDHTGMLATMTVEAATDREVFLAYLDHVLCPKLRPGHVVVMDNLSARQSRRRARKDRGVRGFAALPAALLARPQPYRKSLGKTQTRPPSGCCQNRRRTPVRHRRTAALPLTP